MSTYVSLSKLVSEDVDLVTSFLSRLQIGETLVTCNSSVAVFAGTDPTPLSMKSGIPTISGTDVIQKIIDGVAGVIYIVYISARTSLNNVFVQEVKLAVLSDAAAIPP